MQTHVVRNAVAAGIAAALLSVAPGARAHNDRDEHARDRHAREHAVHHRHHAYHGPRWLRPDRHVRQPVAHFRPFWHRWHYRSARHGPRVVVHAPYYCAACGKRFQRERRFHHHLREQHRLMHHIQRHLVRWYGGWAYFG